MRKPVIAVVAVVAVLAAGVATGYAYYFSGMRTAPKPLALASASPSAAASQDTGASTTGAAITGKWTVSQGSTAGYRVKEVFAGQTSTHEAVARSSSVTGGFSVTSAASGLQAQAIRFAAQLSDLQSQDQVAGFNVSQRDRIVSRSLDVQQYPDAVFQASSAAVPTAVASGGAGTITVPGQLTIHGVTKSADARVQARLSGAQLQLVGTTAVNMTDFGIQPPQVPITKVDPQVTIEFQLVLARAA